MNLTGPFPTLAPNDPASEVPAYTEAMSAAIEAMATRGAAVLPSSVTNFTTAQAPIVQRFGPLVVVQARLKRNVSGSIYLMTLPVGFRPSRQVHAWCIKAATTSVLLQIDELGAVATPFESVVSDYIITIAFSTVA